MSAEREKAITHGTSVSRVSIAEEMNARYRATMEDAYVAIDGFGGDPATGYFGVYDGHGGRAVSEFLRIQLHRNVEKVLKEAGGHGVEECLKAAFLLTDMECGKVEDPNSGSTAVVCIVRSVGPKKYLYTANCGDARAVLCRNGRAQRLSKDHKATDAEEVARIEAVGGFVLRSRVMGVLAVARSFGDFVLKKYVTAEPFTSATKLDSTCQFVIVACDGVWDVIGDQEAIDMVRENVGGPGSVLGASAARCSQVIVDGALARGSTDNVTCMVVFF